jgi:hypothetical protein
MPYLRIVEEPIVGDVLGPASDGTDMSADDGLTNPDPVTSFAPQDTYSDGGTGGGGGGPLTSTPAPTSAPPFTSTAAGVPTWMLVAGAAAVGVGLIALIHHRNGKARRR